MAVLQNISRTTPSLANFCRMKRTSALVYSKVAAACCCSGWKRRWGETSALVFCRGVRVGIRVAASLAGQAQNVSKPPSLAVLVMSPDPTLVYLHLLFCFLRLRKSSRAVIVFIHGRLSNSFGPRVKIRFFRGTALGACCFAHNR